MTKAIRASRKAGKNSTSTQSGNATKNPPGKTRPTPCSVEDFLAKVKSERATANMEERKQLAALLERAARMLRGNDNELPLFMSARARHLFPPSDPRGN